MPAAPGCAPLVQSHQDLDHGLHGPSHEVGNLDAGNYLQIQGQQSTNRNVVNIMTGE
jgi:hypothetical protein